MTIRPAHAGDAASIADIWNSMIRDTLATFTTVEKTAAEIAEMITNRAGAFWVVEVAGRVEGFVTYGPFRGGPGYAATVEHTVILAPAAQGRGYGRALLDMACGHAARRGKHVMVAGISSANPDAVTFHAHLGFAEVARMPEVGRKQGQWLDLILMQKTLSAP